MKNSILEQMWPMGEVLQMLVYAQTFQMQSKILIIMY